MAASCLSIPPIPSYRAIVLVISNIYFYKRASRTIPNKNRGSSVTDMVTMNLQYLVFVKIFYFLRLGLETII